MGDARGADDEYAAVEVVAALSAAGGQVYNRGLAMFYADHDLEPALALSLAQAEIANRRDVHGYDALAWALYRNGSFAEARRASDAALALGTPSAPFRYHSGLIWLAPGDQAQAANDLSHALAISPMFHPLHAPHARSVVASLEVAA